MIIRILEAHPALQLEPRDRPWTGERFRVGRGRDNDLVVVAPGVLIGGNTSMTFERDDDGSLVVRHLGSNHEIAVHSEGARFSLPRPGARRLAIGDRVDVHTVLGPLAVALVLVDDATSDDAPSAAPPKDAHDAGPRAPAGAFSFGHAVRPAPPGADDAARPAPIGTFADDASRDGVLADGDARPAPAGEATAEAAPPKRTEDDAPPGVRAFLDGTVSQHLLMVRVLHAHESLPLAPSDWVFQDPTFSIGTAKENDLAFPQPRGLSPMGPTSLRLERDEDEAATVVHLTPATSGVFSSYRVLVQRADGTRQSLDRPGEKTSGVRLGDVLELETYEAGRAVLLRLAMIRLVRREARGPAWAKLVGSDHQVVVHRMGAARQQMFEVLVDGWPIPSFCQHTETTHYDYPKKSVVVLYEGDRPLVRLPGIPKGPLELKREAEGTWSAEARLARPSVETPDTAIYPMCHVRFVFTAGFDQVRVWVDESIDLSR